MPRDAPRRHPFDEVAEAFAGRLRQGEEPSPDEYAKQFPEMAEQIWRLFPTIALIERCSPPGPANAGLGASTRRGRFELPCQLGDFRLLREVGRGGMGVIYEAEQTSLGRRVALKILSPAAIPDGTHLRRFRQEAGSAARLHHTNIVPVFGLGECDGVHFYAMQFIHGKSLQQMLSSDAAQPEAKLPQGTALFSFVARAGLEVAEALAYAHAQGILHRDIKPSNLLVDEQGTIWVADFGLAKADESGNLTASGEFVGTLRYLAPECLRGEASPLSDQFALALTLYECLAGRPAYAASDRLLLLQQVALGSVPPLRKINPAIPRDLETVLLKALGHEPGSRYASARALADDFRRFLEDRTVLARRSGPATRLWRWCRRNPVTAGLSAAVLLLLISVAAVSTVAAFRLQDANEQTGRQLKRAETAESELTSSLEHMTTARRERTESLFESHLVRARAGRFGQQVGQRFQGLTAMAEAAQIATELNLPEARVLELRSEAIACLALPDVRRTRQWDGFPRGTRGNVQFDPLMQHYARCESDVSISIRRVADDQELARLPGDFEFQFSPDGRYVVDKTRSPLHVWEWRRQKVVLEIGISGVVPAIAFDDDSRRLAVAVDRAHVAIHDLRGGTLLQLLNIANAHALAFHPTENRLAVRAADATEIHDLATNRVLGRFATPFPDGAVGLSWHPAGRLLAGGASNDVFIWDTVQGTPYARLAGHQSGGLRVHFARDGSLLFSDSYDGTGRVWDVPTKRLVLVTPCMCNHGTWVETGLLAQQGTRLETWEFATGSEYRALSARFGDPATVNSCGDGSFSPDGDWLAIPAPDGVRLWNAVAGTEAAHLAVGDVRAVVFHPDGRSLIASGVNGIHHWPFFKRDGAMQLGPPARLPFSGGAEKIAINGTARLLAFEEAAPSPVVRLVDLEPAVESRLTVRHDLVRFLALSLTGEWLATGTWNGYGIKVWNAISGELVHDLLAGARISRVAFTPDQRFLITAVADEFAFWKVGTWEKHRGFPARGRLHVPGILACSGNGALIALGTTPTEVTLVDGLTLKTLAILEPPFQEQYWTAGFDPEGSRLFLTTRSPVAVRVWDLRRIREQLVPLGLDWPQPPFAPAGPATDPSPPVDVDLGELAPATK
jgi:serine/threonine protein kinase/WD40 repeat protein